MSELYVEDPSTEEDWIRDVAKFIRECGGITTKREIGKHIPRPPWLTGPLGSWLEDFGFEVIRNNEVKVGTAMMHIGAVNGRGRVRRREEQWDNSLETGRKRQRVRVPNLRVSADISGFSEDSDLPFQFRSEPPRDEEQRNYKRLLESDTPVLFVLGKAGTGKTLFAAQEGLRRLSTSQNRRIILTRPAVEADDKMGFLPGSLDDKLQPFVAPAMDAIDRQADPGTAKMLVSKSRIKLAPLSHMRGTTMDDAFVLADEMQNATLEQLKMLTTRVGTGTKLVICGDPHQSDRFGAHQQSPLVAIAEEVEGGGGGAGTFSTVRLSAVQRSRVAQDALALWDRFDQKRRHVELIPHHHPDQALLAPVAVAVAPSAAPSALSVDNLGVD